MVSVGNTEHSFPPQHSEDRGRTLIWGYLASESGHLGWEEDFCMKARMSYLWE